MDYQTTGQRETHGDKCIDLYSSKPKGWFKEKAYKTAVDYDFEKSKDSCTFAPKINDPSQMQNLGDQNVDAIRGVDNTMDRMQKARQMQLERRLMTERGMPAQMLA